MTHEWRRSFAVALSCALLSVSFFVVSADAGTVICQRKEKVRLRVNVCRDKEVLVHRLGDASSDPNSLESRVTANAASAAQNAAGTAALATSLDAILDAGFSQEQMALLGELLTALSRVDLDQGDGTPAPTLRLSGVNLQIVDGSGSTGEPNTPGVGNLIVGYSENPDDEARTGSHTLVVGPEHSWTSYGGVLAGKANTVSSPWSSVSGGRGNVASGYGSSVLGGSNNAAEGDLSSISAGEDNLASGSFSSVTGGIRNHATGWAAVVSGGSVNVSSGYYSAVSGGGLNEASGSHSSVAGGGNNLAPGPVSSVSGGEQNRAEGTGSVVSGGLGNVASGSGATVSGGFQDTAPVNNSHVP